PAGSLQKLELEVDPRTPLAIGESRPYKVWGVPKDGSPRRDLTPHAGGQGGAQVRVAPESNAGADIVAHAPPAVIAKALGAFSMQAEYQNLKSESIRLEIQ